MAKLPVVLEKFESRPSSTGSNASVDLIYSIEGTDDDIEAKSALVAAVPTDYDGLVLKNCNISRVGPSVWTGTAKYELPQNNKPKPSTGDKVLSFDTSGGTQHITQSLQTVHKYAPPGKTAPDFKGAIGVTHDSVEGCDITVPNFRFSVTCYIPNEKVTSEYIGNIFRLTGKVNDDHFTVFGLGSFEEGECLFLGAQGSKRGNGSDWEIQFSFAGSPNQTGITVGDIQNIEKKGWEYMWIRYADAEDTDAKAIVKRPVAVYIEKVYLDGNLSMLDPDYTPEA